MTSFAEYAPMMHAHDFDLYASQGEYPNYPPTTSQSYIPTTSYIEGPCSVAMSTMDSYSHVPAVATMSRMHEFHYRIDAASQDIKSSYRYSPAGSPAHSASNLFEMVPPQLSTASESGASAQSTSSSAMGSPPSNSQSYHEPWNSFANGLGLAPGIVQQDHFGHDPFVPSGVEHDSIPTIDKLPGCVDPTLINTFPSPIPYSAVLYPDLNATPSHRLGFPEQSPSPAPSHTSVSSQNRLDSSRMRAPANQSPYLHTTTYHPYPTNHGSRRPSMSSIHSRHSYSSRRSGSYELDDEAREKGLCPIPECGRVFKDLKAHMLTHQTERPEKCPIASCEYHLKGFARKYDKNRHTLTHYKGTMVCGFCPGPGSTSEKSFNRADVFKRHLTSVHGVEQTPPNSRKRSPPAGKRSYSAAQNTTAGTCSTCGVTFANAQEFYEHLDDCVLRVVQQTDPSEAINQKHLGSMSEDKRVKETMERHGLPNAAEYAEASYEENDDEDEELIETDDRNDDTYGSRNFRSGDGNPINKSAVTKKRRPGLTYSKGGVALTTSDRKRRKNYPASWGCATDKMKMKKRVLCIYDGGRRLWKDDMMLNSEFEVRVPLSETDGRSYVTDLDVQTLKRADGVWAATEEERGPWIVNNVRGV